MSKVEALKAEIERLSSPELAELSRWLAERKWTRWDTEIEADATAGRLDLLTREARDGSAETSNQAFG